MNKPTAVARVKEVAGSGGTLHELLTDLSSKFGKPAIRKGSAARENPRGAWAFTTQSNAIATESKKILAILQGHSTSITMDKKAFSKGPTVVLFSTQLDQDAVVIDIVIATVGFTVHATPA